MTSLVFDCEVRENPETVGWTNYEGMGLSVSCCYFPDIGHFRFYDIATLHRLELLLEKTELVISFNGIHFDVPLVEALLQRSIPLRIHQHFDLCAEVEKVLGHRLSLDVLAQATLQQGKSGHGSKAPELWKAGRYAELYSYCQDDVRLTWSLYSFARRYGYLLDPQGRCIPLATPDGVPAWSPYERPETKIEPATSKQLSYLQQLRPGWNPTPGLTKRQAHDLIEAWQKERARA